MKYNFTEYEVSGACILFLGFYYLSNYDYTKTYDGVLIGIKSDKYEGLIVEKYYDEKNHNDPTIILSNNKILTFYDDEYKQLDLNDSISKKKNSTILYVFKKNNTIKIDLKTNIEFLKKKNKHINM